ncbi:MAG: hypothetical protein EX260_06440, partial [Desulfobulbaceae bacterium]
MRRPPVVALSFALLASYAVFLLPSAETESSLLFYLNINLFILYVLICSGNVLADGKKPESLKMLVALALIAIMCWLFYRYSGAEWGRLRD